MLLYTALYVFKNTLTSLRWGVKLIRIKPKYTIWLRPSWRALSPHHCVTCVRFTNRETSSDEFEVSGYSVTIECSFHTLVIEEYLLAHCNFLQILFYRCLEFISQDGEVSGRCYCSEHLLYITSHNISLPSGTLPEMLTKILILLLKGLMVT